MSDRLVTRADASRIISALNIIADKGGKRIVKPTLTADSIEYDGETHSVTEILDGFDSNYMILTGDFNASEQGTYIAFVQLKRDIDTWSDGSTDAITLLWKYGIGGDNLSWSNASDEALVLLIQLADEEKIDLAEDCGWEVGDIREVQLSAMSATGVGESHVAQTVQLALVAKDTGVQDNTNPCYNYKYTTATSGRTYPSFIVQQVDGLSNGTSGEYGYMNSSDTNAGGWNGCARRTWCNSVYKAAIPSSIVDIFKQVKVKTMNNGSQSGATLIESNDYFFFPAEKEVFGSRTYSNTTEADALSQWPYYSTSANRIKHIGSLGSASGWWERSPSPGGANAFCYVSGRAYVSDASYTSLLAPTGCI